MTAWSFQNRFVVEVTGGMQSKVAREENIQLKFDRDHEGLTVKYTPQDCNQLLQ